MEQGGGGGGGGGIGGNANLAAEIRAPSGFFTSSPLSLCGRTEGAKAGSDWSKAVRARGTRSSALLRRGNAGRGPRPRASVVTSRIKQVKGSSPASAAPVSTRCPWLWLRWAVVWRLGVGAQSQAAVVAVGSSNRSTQLTKRTHPDTGACTAAAAQAVRHSRTGSQPSWAALRGVQ